MPEEFDRRRILVVDDEERMVRFIRMNLEHDGFQVAEAFNGKQAIQKLRDVTPDLILLDVMMPDLDGFEVLETIREVCGCDQVLPDQRSLRTHSQSLYRRTPGQIARSVPRPGRYIRIHHAQSAGHNPIPDPGPIWPAANRENV